MSKSTDEATSRRLFLRFLVQSPLFATMGLSVGSGGRLLAAERLPLDEDLISSPEDAINVFDFQAVAKKKLRPAHYGYLATGVDDDATLRVNREGFSKFQLRMRRLIDVRKIDMSTEVVGVKWENPIALAPVASQKMYHPEGEIAVAKAAQAKGHLQILSTVTTSSVEDVTEARRAPVWYQLYPTNDWNITRALLKRAEAAGSPVVVLTVDLLGGRNTETATRFAKADYSPCGVCHEKGGYYQRKPMFDGLDVSGVKQLSPSGLTWDYLRRVRDTTSMKLFVKGIVTREDAELCVEHGADGIIVSNHGGRAEESGRSTIECLPEIIQAVSGQVPVLIDSGFRRGTDIFKALALGAQAVCVGRPYLWGLAAFGQAGVEAVLDILRAELELVMKQAGTTSIDQITRALVTDRSC